MRTLHARVCTLEPQVVAHAPEMFPVLCDPAIYEFEGEPPPSVEKLAAGYGRSESRQSPDGKSILLNWVVRVPNGQLTGYVQATVIGDGSAYLGYEFSSRHWRRGLATASLQALLEELAASYDVSLAAAVLKASNFRSLGLVQKLGFMQAMASEAVLFEHEVGRACLPHEARNEEWRPTLRCSRPATAGLASLRRRLSSNVSRHALLAPLVHGVPGVTAGRSFWRSAGRSNRQSRWPACRPVRPG